MLAHERVRLGQRRREAGEGEGDAAEENFGRGFGGEGEFVLLQPSDQELVNGVRRRCLGILSFEL